MISLSYTFAVMKNVNHHTPRFVVSHSVKQATSNLVLVDPTFDTCAAGDVLLGADMVSAVLTGQVLGSGLPAAVLSLWELPPWPPVVLCLVNVH